MVYRCIHIYRDGDVYCHPCAENGNILEGSYIGCLFPYILMRRSIPNINIPPPPLGAFERFLFPESQECDLKGHPGVGNLNRKYEVQNISILAGACQAHMVVSEHGAI